MRHLNTLLLLMALAGSGCAYVTSSEPVGQQPVRLEAGELSGAWAARNTVVTFEPLDIEQGRYRMQWSENGQRKSLELLLRAGPPGTAGAAPAWQFWNARVADFEATEGSTPGNDAGGAHPDHYYWGRYRLDGNELVAWGPSAERLAPLVADGTLPGELDGDDVRLAPLGPDQLEVLSSGSRGVLMDWEYPVMLYRILEP